MEVVILVATDNQVFQAADKLEKLIMEYLQIGYKLQGGISTTFSVINRNKNMATASIIVTKEK